MCATIWVCTYEGEISKAGTADGHQLHLPTPPPPTPRSTRQQVGVRDQSPIFSGDSCTMSPICMDLYISMSMDGSIIYIYIGRNQSCQPGRPWKAPRWAKNCNKSFQTKTCLGFFFILSLLYYIYIRKRGQWCHLPSSNKQDCLVAKPQPFSWTIAEWHCLLPEVVTSPWWRPSNPDTALLCKAFLFQNCIDLQCHFPIHAVVFICLSQVSVCWELFLEHVFWISTKMVYFHNQAPCHITSSCKATYIGCMRV